MKIVSFSLGLILLFFFCCSSFTQTQADGTYATLGTADSLDGSNDAINFSQGRVWTIDQYGKYIWLTQQRTGPTSHWAWSNDLGANWSQGNESYAALTRGSVAYDSINDVLHVIWAATDTNDGIIYRRYSITRDGSNNITAIQRVDSGTVNLQLDVSASRSLEQPVALWVNDGSTDGSLVAIWIKQGTSLTETRGSMRKLTMTAADGVAGNWQALDNSADTFSTDSPAVAADKIYGITSSSRVTASAIIRGGSGSRKDDLYIFTAVSNSDAVLAYRAIWDSANKDWRGGFQSPVTVGSMDDSTGYSLKEQLITKPVLDSTHDRLYIGWARWKDVSAGDTVSIAYLNSSDTASSTVDIYSANGTHSYAPTLDIAYDSTLDEVYISYIESTTNGDNGSINYKTYNGSTLSDSTRFYTSPGGSAGANGSADIPILYENRTSNNRLLFAFRINGALPPTGVNPHSIDWGYISLAQPTSTPTPTPTPQPISIPSNTSSSTTSSSSPNTTCTMASPTSIPTLFQLSQNGYSVALYFSPVQGKHTGYTISYGMSANADQYTSSFGYTDTSGVVSHTINYLTPNTTWYFKIRGNNECSTGNWSKTLSIKTGKLPSLISSSRSQAIHQNSCQNYVVQPGDTLWKISQKLYGNGSKYQNILSKNKTVINSPNLIRVGWRIQLGC